MTRKKIQNSLHILTMAVYVHPVLPLSVLFEQRRRLVFIRSKVASSTSRIHIFGQLRTVLRMVSRSYPFRIDVILTYNQLKYDIENIGALSLPAADTAPPAGTDAAGTGAETDVPAETEPDDRHIVLDDSNPLYAEINRIRVEEEMIEPTGFKGSPTVIVGKSGYLYENGYINEYLGYSDMYREVTEDRMKNQVEMLAYIENRLREDAKALVFVLKPSKASSIDHSKLV